MLFAKQDSEVAELRRWARRARWSQCQTFRDRARLIRSWARTPYAFGREARRCLTEYAASVQDRFGVSPLRQAAELAWFRIRFGLDPIAYYRYQLFRTDRKLKAGQFVRTPDVGCALTWLIQRNTEDPGVLRDKLIFERWCREHGLPALATLVEIEDGRVTANDQLPLPRADLFSKPSNWQGGNGAECWAYVGTTAWCSNSGRTCTEPALLAYLERQSAELHRPILLQRRIVNHPSLRTLVKDSLCTVRVVTTRLPGAEATVVLAVYRMPVAAAVADNFDGGGIAAPIDLRTGRLGSAMRKYPRVAGPIAMHPDTSAQIEGVQLPFWSDVTPLVLRAHHAVTWTSVPVVGWDVALTEDGPLLLEGNNLPCSTLSQMPGGIPLGATSVIASVNAHLRERFDRPA